MRTKGRQLLRKISSNRSRQKKSHYRSLRACWVHIWPSICSPSSCSAITNRFSTQTLFNPLMKFNKNPFLHDQILPKPTQPNLLWNYLTPFRPALSLPDTTLNVIGFFDMRTTNVKNVPNIKLKQMQMYQHIGNAANNSLTVWQYKQWMVSQQCFIRLRFDVWYLWCDICLFVSAQVYSFCYLMNIIACIKNDEID